MTYLVKLNIRYELEAPADVGLYFRLAADSA